MLAWKKYKVSDEFPINGGDIVRGNYSKIEYRVEHAFNNGGDGWVIQARGVNNERSTAWFNDLGKRIDDYIEILDERRPDDKLLIISQKSPKKVKSKPKPKLGQMRFPFWDK
jgi:hypothetical protein